jgi:hypothetical protein
LQTFRRIDHDHDKRQGALDLQADNSPVVVCRFVMANDRPMMHGTRTAGTLIVTLLSLPASALAGGQSHGRSYSFIM